ncbi:hypothetical protein TNCV_4815411 [Trichonephila clavipes]|nr:hypothetical protein TNCV_4815411 [Trichonephila clavipes]
MLPLFLEEHITTEYSTTTKNIQAFVVDSAIYQEKGSPNTVYKLRGEAENNLRSHNYIGKHGRKRSTNEIKRHKDSKATTQNAVQNALLHKETTINEKYDIKASQVVFEITAIGIHIIKHLYVRHRRDIDCRTRSKILAFTDCRSGVGYLCHQVHFRIDRRVVYKALHGTPEKKKNPEEVNQRIWETDRRDHHTQSICLEISGPNGPVHISHNEVVFPPVETSCGAKQVRGHWLAIPEVHPVEGRDACQSLVMAVRCIGQVNCPP